MIYGMNNTALLHTPRAMKIVQAEVGFEVERSLLASGYLLQVVSFVSFLTSLTSYHLFAFNLLFESGTAFNLDRITYPFGFGDLLKSPSASCSLQ